MPKSERWRRSGLDFLGDIPWGTHLSQFYHQKEDLLESVIPFLDYGLQNNESCLWITTNLFTTDEAHRVLAHKIPDFERYQKTGQIVIFDCRKWYLHKEEKVVRPAHRLIRSAQELLNKGLSKKRSGLRVVGGVHQIRPAHWPDFLDYEEKVHDFFEGQKLVALCTYSLPHCPLNNIKKVIDRHHKTFLKKGGVWEVVEGSVA